MWPGGQRDIDSFVRTNVPEEQRDIAVQLQFSFRLLTRWSRGAHLVHGKKCLHDSLAESSPGLFGFTLCVHNKHVAATEDEIGQRSLPPGRFFLADVVTLKDHA